MAVETGLSLSPESRLESKLRTEYAGICSSEDDFRSIMDFYTTHPNVAVRGSGPIFSRFRGDDKFHDIPMQWILSSPEAEVYFVPDLGDRRDPSFKMVTKDGIHAEFAYTGDLLRMDRLVQGDSRLEKIIEMDVQHRFELARGGFQIDGIVDGEGLAPEQVLKQLIDYAYSMAQ